MNELIVAWQDPETRSWIPVGRLYRTQDGFGFCYTKGAGKSSNFRAFPRMPDFAQTYVSGELFPIFANRIMPRSRPEYYLYMAWLGVKFDDAPLVDPLLVLARSEGVRATDGLQLYPVPQPTAEGTYELYFFCHGIRHVNVSAIIEVGKLKSGERLYPMYDVQNPADPFAVALRTGGDAAMIGYVPSFFARDFKAILDSGVDNKAHVLVHQLNDEAPIQLRLLCMIKAMWPKDFVPFAHSDFRRYS